MWWLHVPCLLINLQEKNIFLCTSDNLQWQQYQDLKVKRAKEGLALPFTEVLLIKDDLWNPLYKKKPTVTHKPQTKKNKRRKSCKVLVELCMKQMLNEEGNLVRKSWKNCIRPHCHWRREEKIATKKNFFKGCFDHDITKLILERRKNFWRAKNLQYLTILVMNGALELQKCKLGNNIMGKPINHHWNHLKTRSLINHYYGQ